MTDTIAFVANPSFGWREMDPRLQNANRRRTSSIRRKRVPRIDGVDAMLSLERSNSNKSSSSKSSSFNIILPPTSSDLDVHKKVNNSNFTESDSTFSDDETVGPSTPRVAVKSTKEEVAAEEDDFIYLATHITTTSTATITIEEESVPFNNLPKIVQENPTLKISWAKRNPTHAVIETYLPPTCPTCLHKLEEKKMKRKKVPDLDLSSLQLAQTSIPSSPITSVASSATNSATQSPLNPPSQLKSPAGESWGIAI